jgi:hypothetical protein
MVKLTTNALKNGQQLTGALADCDWDHQLFSATNAPSDIEARYDGLGRCVGTVTYSLAKAGSLMLSDPDSR